jgi:cytochrome P450
MSIIDDRKNGKTVSYGDTPDLLSIMIRSDFFKDKPEKMIDELIGMFMAGMKTT